MGGSGGGMLAAAPTPVYPASSAVLPPTRAYFFVKDAAVPPGLTVDGHEWCQTTGSMMTIAGESKCPNQSTTSRSYYVLDPLTAGATYLWKVRTVYDDASVSPYTTVWSFSTDMSLVGWWQMDGDVVDKLAANNGALQNGAGFGNGIKGQALEGDGMDDYADMGTGLNLTGPLSVLAWVWPDAVPTNPDTGIVNKGDLDYALTYHTTGDAFFYIGQGGNSLQTPLSIGSWHQVAGTFDGTANVDGMRLYANGVEVGKRTSQFATTGATGSLWFGRYSNSYFDGRIDEVGIYNVALTSGAVLNDYCALQVLSGADPLPSACIPGL